MNLRGWQFLSRLFTRLDLRINSCQMCFDPFPKLHRFMAKLIIGEVGILTEERIGFLYDRHDQLHILLTFVASEDLRNKIQHISGSELLMFWVVKKGAKKPNRSLWHPFRAAKGKEFDPREG